MKILFIGGTGTISTAISKALAKRGDELYLINRGSRNEELPEGHRGVLNTLIMNTFHQVVATVGDKIERHNLV